MLYSVSPPNIFAYKVGYIYIICMVKIFLNSETGKMYIQGFKWSDLHILSWSKNKDITT